MAREQKQVHVRRVTPRGDAARERVAREQQRQFEEEVGTKESNDG